LRAKSRGSASIEMVIIVTFLIVFIFLPIVGIGMEQLIIHYSINHVVEIMESGLYSMMASIDLIQLSEGIIYFDQLLIKEYFQQLIDEELGDLVAVNVVEMMFYPYSVNGLPCSIDKEMQYDTLHVQLTIAYEHKLYKSLLSNQGREIRFHFDLEIPKNS